MRVCHIVPSLEERHGGPSKSVRALANAAATLGARVELLATLEHGQDMAPVGANAASVRVFPRIAPRWLCRSPELRQHLRGAAFDVVHNHSLWLLTLRYACEAAHRQAAPLVISPRGMMSGWAWRHRRWRKRLAGVFVHPGALVAAAGWHATSPGEADDIRALGFKQPVCVAPNGVTIPAGTQVQADAGTWHRACPALAGRRVALFYSRFHRKKRVRELLDLWLAAPRGDWFLLLAGVPEEYSVAEIQGWIDRAGAAGRAAVLDSRQFPAPYGAASLFVLPTHSENFGLVIAEALAAGVPCLVTDTTPWAGLGANGAGWCVPWENFSATLGTALATDTDVLAAMGRRGREWVGRDFTWGKAATLLNEFYRHLRDERR
jgi:glycosyltransferase involved in cell wall biosynthesis